LLFHAIAKIPDVRCFEPCYPWCDHRVNVRDRRQADRVACLIESASELDYVHSLVFRYLAHGDNAPLQYGLIAEEVAEVYPELVARNKDGQVETVMYQFLAPMLLNEVQKEHRRNEEQANAFQAENAALRDQLERLAKRVEELDAHVTKSR
jgi:hypothetical protein